MVRDGIRNTVACAKVVAVDALTCSSQGGRHLKTVASFAEGHVKCVGPEQGRRH